ncbi:Hypothetical protein CINCED_3A018576 [Cinara cedri]|uniref:Uncharacterized protein n=1 Tax=Cinara cedri TaxID=506608 RepID=A0A5E4M2T7_9HEMI|nr:Hypothetical protein CINCED_3A018576 [Cinara cedri]
MRTAIVTICWLIMLCEIVNPSHQVPQNSASKKYRPPSSMDEKILVQTPRTHLKNELGGGSQSYSYWFYRSQIPKSNSDIHLKKQWKNVQMHDVKIENNDHNYTRGTTPEINSKKDTPIENEPDLIPTKGSPAKYEPNPIPTEETPAENYLDRVDGKGRSVIM